MGIHSSLITMRRMLRSQAVGSVIARSVIAAFLMALTTPLASADSATATTDISAQAAVRQLDIIGRQEMLSHQLAGLTCFVVNEVDPLRSKLQAMQAHWGLQSGYSQLRHGDAVLRLDPLTQPKIIAIFDAMEPYMLASYRAFNSLLNQESQSPQHLDDLVDLSWTMSTQARGINAQVRAAHLEAGVITHELEQTVSALNEMRVLSQVIGKAFCHAAYGNSPDTAFSTFKSASERFSDLLAAFPQGDDALGLPKPHPVMAQQVSIVSREYAKLSPIIAVTLNEGAASSQYSALMLNQSAKVLAELDNSFYLLAAVQ